MTPDEAIQRAIVDEAATWCGPGSTPDRFCALLVDLFKSDPDTAQRAIDDVVRLVKHYETREIAA